MNKKRETRKEDKGPGSDEHIRKHIQRIRTRGRARNKKGQRTTDNDGAKEAAGRGERVWWMRMQIIFVGCDCGCARVLSRGRRRVKHQMESRTMKAAERERRK